MNFEQISQIIGKPVANFAQASEALGQPVANFEQIKAVLADRKAPSVSPHDTLAEAIRRAKEAASVR